MRGQMTQHQPAQTVAAKSGPYVHALDFSVLGAKELNATTAGRCAAMPRHEECKASRRSFSTLYPCRLASG
jgi:hypothetical protein